jgi:ferredoxin
MLPSPTTALETFTLVLARSQLELVVGAGESMVDVLHLAGVPVETLCEQGVCGTCETRWLDGDPEHRDSCLDEDQRRTHLVVCCARSRSERLTLDL